MEPQTNTEKQQTSILHVNISQALSNRLIMAAATEKTSGRPATGSKKGIVTEALEMWLNNNSY